VCHFRFTAGMHSSRQSRCSGHFFFNGLSLVVFNFRALDTEVSTELLPFSSPPLLQSHKTWQNSSRTRKPTARSSVPQGQPVANPAGISPTMTSAQSDSDIFPSKEVTPGLICGYVSYVHVLSVDRSQKLSPFPTS